MIIIDILKYFARYPLKLAVLDMFALGRSTTSGYAELIDYVTNLSDHSRVPELTGFVFGESFDYVKARIDKFTATYMYVDFGELSSARGQYNSIDDSFKLAITIARKMNDQSDLVEYALVSDQTLDLLKSVIQMMMNDQSETSWMKQISKNYTLVPFDAKEFNSHGWTILFNREAKDMLNIKNIE